MPFENQTSTEQLAQLDHDENAERIAIKENPDQQKYNKLIDIARDTVETLTANFDDILIRNRAIVAKTKNRISKLEQQKSEETNERRAEFYTQPIANAKRTLRTQEAFVEFARIPTVEDVVYRYDVVDWFPKKVKEVVPDNLPLVFHGTSNFGQLREIIRTNGLFTPEERGESMTSFAVQIDVGAKSNVSVPCNFAEPHRYWMPYGAIFSFMPKPEEINNVNQTKDSTEVFGGVNGVNFRQEPERLYGIITTPENIEQVQTWCEEYGLDKNKVMTHQDFIESIAKYK